MYESQLKELGLTDNEAKIYLLLLKQRAMNPAEIAQKLGLHRGYVYDALERMKEKGVTNTVLVRNKTHFQATNPENLVELLRLRLEDFQKIIPDLKKLMLQEKEETRVEVHRGKYVYRTLIKDMLATMKRGEEALLIGIDEGVLMQEIDPLYLQRYLHALDKRNLRERTIIKKGGKQLAHKHITYREIDAKYIGNTAQIIYSNKVALFILGMPYHLVVIENTEVADTYRRQFELLWSSAR